MSQSYQTGQVIVTRSVSLIALINHISRSVVSGTTISEYLQEISQRDFSFGLRRARLARVDRFMLEELSRLIVLLFV